MQRASRWRKPRANASPPANAEARYNAHGISIDRRARLPSPAAALHPTGDHMRQTLVHFTLAVLYALSFLVAPTRLEAQATTGTASMSSGSDSDVWDLVDRYKSVRLTADLSG